MRENKSDLATTILEENTKILYGIFGVVIASGFFPTWHILNGFFSQGNDPCDQDGCMEAWRPFELDEEEYFVLLEWWLTVYPNSRVESFGVESWDDWIVEVVERD